jgi:hypothetical protein
MGAGTTTPTLVAGIVLVLVALLADLRPSAQGSSFGLGQSILLMLGTAVTFLAIDLRRGSGQEWRASLTSLAGGDAVRFGAILLQLALVVFVVGWFQLENPALAKQVVPFTAAAFAIHHLAAPSRRLELFVVASLAAYVMVLGFVNAGCSRSPRWDSRCYAYAPTGHRSRTRSGRCSGRS